MTSMKRVLIVSPNFPPRNAPDHQRVRHCLPYLAENGWEPTVLCLHAKEADGVHDPDLSRTVPEQTSVIRTGAIPRGLTRFVGLGSMALRALPTMAARGAQILRQQKHDLVFFSTTAFPVMAAGVMWKKRFGVPYVLDFQDPWRNDFYDKPGAPAPPGGNFKYRVLAKPVAAMLEPRTVKNADAFICVADDYGINLAQRYDIPADRFLTLPFAASEADRDLALTPAIRHDVFDKNDGLRHWVSIGIAQANNAPLLKILFSEFARLRDMHPECGNVRFHFVGTSYARNASGPGIVKELAEAAGIGDIVEERCGRIPYLAALKAMSESDVVLGVGNTDASHTPSKIYPAVLSRRPLLAFYHEAGSALRILEGCGAGNRVAWHPEDQESSRRALADALQQLLLRPRAAEYDEHAFAVYTAKEMTRRLCANFDLTLSKAGR